MPKNPLELFPEVWKSYVLTFNTASEIINKRLCMQMKKQGFNISPRDGWVLVAADEKHGSFYQNQIADGLFINRNVMGRIVSRLEKKGLLSRKRYLDNRREYRLEVTPKGKRIVTEMWQTWDERTQVIFAPLTLESVQMGAALARELITHHVENRV